MPDQPIPDEAVEAAERAIMPSSHKINPLARKLAIRVTEAIAPIIRQQAFAEAKARVEAQRKSDPVRGRVLNYNQAIDIALTAIDGAADDE
jgi:hypothetical protein